MSWEAQAWAAKQRTGSSSSKLVLLGLASCADTNHCAFPSIQWLCDFGDLNRKTVIAALQRLEDGMFPLIRDTGERKGRTKQVKVYRLASAEVENARLDPDAETVPKAERSQKRNSSGSTSKQSQKRDTEPFMEPKPPLSPNGDKTPTRGSNSRSGRKKAGSRLASDWTPPPIADLSEVTIKLVRQWPSGAYEAVCETFRLHYQTTDGPAGVRGNWNDVLSKWLVKDHAKIMRDAKAGVSFADLAPKKITKPQPVRIVRSKAKEDATSRRIHDAIRRQVGSTIWESWFKSVAIIHDEPGLKVFVGGDFQRGWIEDHYRDRLGRIAREVIGQPIKWVRIEVETVQARGKDNGEEQEAA